MKVQRLLLALLAAAAAGAVTALPGNRGRALRQVPTRYKFWAGCAAPAYCQPADGPNLVDPAAAAAASADDSKVTASAAAPGLSPYWGAAGELWTPAGKLMDWSFAGYRQGNEPLPTPNVTISYKAFQRPSMSDTQALLAAVAWAHKQPYDRWCVIRIPAGVHTLDRQVIITRPRLVLRGDGSAATVLKIDKPLKAIPGVPRPGGGYGYYNQEAFINLRGKYLQGPPLTAVVGQAERGAKLITVANPSRLQAGQYVALILSDTKKGPLTQYLLGSGKGVLPMGRVTPGRSPLVRFVVRIMRVNGNWVELERPLPLQIRPEYSPVLLPRVGTVFDSGVEGLTFRFGWAKYGGHHYEDGYNALEFKEVYDCWARDVATVNADSGVFIDKCTGVQISGLKMTQTAPRDPMRPKSLGDGHWGVHSGSSGDVLVDGFAIEPNMLHCVGADAMSMFAVFTRGKMANGNLELHRGGPNNVLFSDIDCGKGDHCLQSGGPEASGPNTFAWTTFWNVRATGGAAIPPPGSNTAKQGDCAFGPDMLFVGTRLSGKFCPWWEYQQAVVHPANLYQAQLNKRLGRTPAQ